MAYAPNTNYITQPATIDDANRKRTIATPLGSKNIYRGFNTHDSFGRSFKLSNQALVNRDILNHIFTIPGERIGRPEFGTIIPMLAFETITPELVTTIENEIRKVIDNDPRVELIELAVLPTPNNNAILTVVDLKYIELDGLMDTLSFTVGGH